MESIIVTIKPRLVGLNDRDTFIEEARKMNIAAKDEKGLLNKILSPGFKIWQN